MVLFILDKSMFDPDHDNPPLSWTQQQESSLEDTWVRSDAEQVPRFTEITHPLLQKGNNQGKSKARHQYRLQLQYPQEKPKWHHWLALPYGIKWYGTYMVQVWEWYGQSYDPYMFMIWTWYGLLPSIANPYRVTVLNLPSFYCFFLWDCYVFGKKPYIHHREWYGCAPYHSHIILTLFYGIAMHIWQSGWEMLPQQYHRILTLFYGIATYLAKFHIISIVAGYIGISHGNAMGSLIQVHINSIGSRNCCINMGNLWDNTYTHS